MYMPRRNEKVPVGRICVAFGAFAWDFTQHSTIFLHFVTFMSPLRHHPFNFVTPLARCGVFVKGEYELRLY